MEAIMGQNLMHKETGVAKHVEGWREIHCKGSSCWYNEMTETHWGKIMDEKNKSMSRLGGDDTSVNEVEILERSLGQRRGHIRGVGRTQQINELMSRQKAFETPFDNTCKPAFDEEEHDDESE
ncbi:hypothetical protein E3N88_07638 [Mikania micrantha]|uniref:Uncharacterized protein n=1 Tax=Mikania micrantha TaxID=192012 RepID=A0A5N6PT57_9ASTR|nr:hypothetical protein E3N88_07638 [Mikania micrantha]